MKLHVRQKYPMIEATRTLNKTTMGTRKILDQNQRTGDAKKKLK